MKKTSPVWLSVHGWCCTELTTSASAATVGTSKQSPTLRSPGAPVRLSLKTYRPIASATTTTTTMIRRFRPPRRPTVGVKAGPGVQPAGGVPNPDPPGAPGGAPAGGAPKADPAGCLLYTSDAADEEDSVDLGGRRI